MLTKTKHDVFKEYYTGKTNKAEVICVLDDNCVRFMVYEEPGEKMKGVYRREFGNNEKEKCFRLANEAFRAVKGECI